MSVFLILNKIPSTIYLKFWTLQNCPSARHPKIVNNSQIVSQNLTFYLQIELCRHEDGHLECVYPRSYMQDAAFCQCELK